MKEKIKALFDNVFKFLKRLLESRVFAFILGFAFGVYIVCFSIFFTEKTSETAFADTVDINYVYYTGQLGFQCVSYDLINLDYGEYTEFPTGLYRLDGEYSYNDFFSTIAFRMQYDGDNRVYIELYNSVGQIDSDYSAVPLQYFVYTQDTVSDWFTLFNYDGATPYNSATFNYCDYPYYVAPYLSNNDDILTYSSCSLAGFTVLASGRSIFDLGSMRSANIFLYDGTAHPSRDIKYAYVLEYSDIYDSKLVIVLGCNFSLHSSTPASSSINYIPKFSSRTYYFETALRLMDGFELGYQEGYSQGETAGIVAGSSVAQSDLDNAFNNGVSSANNTVNSNSASWNAGYSAGLSSATNESIILSPTRAVSAILDIELFKIGDFTFKLNYLLYLGLGAMFVTVIIKFLFHG